MIVKLLNIFGFLFAKSFLKSTRCLLIRTQNYSDCVYSYEKLFDFWVFFKNYSCYYFNNSASLILALLWILKEDTLVALQQTLL